MLDGKNFKGLKILYASGTKIKGCISILILVKVKKESHVKAVKQELWQP